MSYEYFDAKELPSMLVWTFTMPLFLPIYIAQFIVGIFRTLVKIYHFANYWRKDDGNRKINNT